ncbi:acetyltransferase, GNAT family [Lactobacillus selangorensis]|uniref:Acetyltransferase, GNAT family n=1 Tax=Lactobacillus selangorensis TaxID=81857 RepID=A0A0R2G864_9LACO|nr:GNAT family N-acetyltransferase [Lactobacillus selangorensis]KRN28770.1 acetyltransferase, GNAT family [Lactobacillus selangorensis]KRN32820.1 acetyltransferase, GNAT family [Lactobacillus selangorensis]
MMIQFENARQADLSRIVAIYNQSIPNRLATADLEPVSVASKQAWFAAFNPDRRPIWVLKQDGQIVGWVSLESFYGRPAYQRTAEISIYLDATIQHQGVGQQTLNFIFSQLPRLQLDTVVAYIFSHNTPSQKLFKRNGFKTWGHLPNVAVMDGQRRSLDILGRHFS